MTKKVLLLNTSLNAENGNSNLLAQQFVKELRDSFAIEVTERDLNQQALAHLSADEMAAWMTPEADRNAEQTALARISDNLIEELQNNEMIVIGMPMYNFGVPSVFKAWIDRIARAGITFKYSEQGPVGLLENKKVVIIAARGGAYAGTPKDTQSAYLKDVFAFLGIEDVEFIYAEGLAMPDKDLRLQEANIEIARLAKKVA
ncbi:FMN-dependent NADH-azoreductase [Thalassotalea sp. PS06]|uniref:FMN-dependent NADH-azoreductase n=1 Tax=Thalassotalea sp. PS06 TaxID=2594005 RepID=UPI001162E49A|nr:NAD(P)H-dependent oxidoreductase [Thalassotalea sp. PS06]QDP02661.1 FMN-dependent NADH-azoreductase [Thalassotalea sp. PS06]